jgi:hypothetical protein
LGRIRIICKGRFRKPRGKVKIYRSRIYVDDKAMSNKERLHCFIVVRLSIREGVCIRDRNE